jgi:hypothetical protein
LNAEGHLLDADGNPIESRQVRASLSGQLRFPASVTDIFVFVHGWRTSAASAQSSFARLFGAINSRRDRWAAIPGAEGPFAPWFVGVQWPSSSAPTPGGYRRIRDRAHHLSAEGHASYVISQLLGYLDAHRRAPTRGPERLRSATGQYLHCIGHSFGGRFLGEAIQRAADPGPETLAWSHRSRRPFGVDTYLAFQMAAPPSIFADRFAGILTDGPVHGPIVLTFSRHDYANAVWHLAMERVAGIGAIGSSTPDGMVSTIALREPRDPYSPNDFATPVVNVDASRVFTIPRWSVTGAHSDFWRSHSIHLIMSLSALAR